MSPTINAQSDERTFSSHFHSAEWNGTDINGISNAEFKDFNSKEKIKYEVHKDEIFKFRYTVDIKEGIFSIKIKSKKRGVIYEKEISGTKSDFLTFKSKEKDRFLITIKGTRASGNFDIVYGDKVDN